MIRLVPRANTGSTVVDKQGKSRLREHQVRLVSNAYCRKIAPSETRGSDFDPEAISG